MATTVHCDIVSAEGSLYSGSATLVVAAGELGDLGVTSGHIPLLTPLKPGPVRIVNDNADEVVLYVSGGFMEVQPNQVTILADTALRAGDLDEAKALQARQDAQKALENQSGDLDYSRALVELAEATAQLRTLSQMRDKLK